MKINHIKIGISTAVKIMVMLAFTGCSKFVDVPPPTDSLPLQLAFANDAKAASVVRLLYAQMTGTTGGLGASPAFSGGVQLAMNVSSDELVPSSATNEFYLHQITPTNSSNESNIWGALYNIIFSANAVIQNVPLSDGISAAGKKQFVAEAKFIRAANYFYLVNLYGDVPLAVGTDYRVNAVLPRSSVEEVYRLIVDDLKDAETNLSPAYIGTTAAVQSPNRFRANKYAAAALLARVYLFRKDYANAEAMANQVIDGAGKAMYDFETNLSRTFLTNSKEVILQIQQPGADVHTKEAVNYIPQTATAIPSYQISDALLNAFEPGDLRKSNWTKTTVNAGKTYYYPFKYKITFAAATGPRTEAMVFLRLSEVYLIRAEARAEQNKLSLAISDLDAVRARSFVPASYVVTDPTIEKEQLLQHIAHERFVELFAENGHRWMDLIRTGKADEVLKNSLNWRPEAKLFPIPKGDIDKNQQLTQNPGYN